MAMSGQNDPDRQLADQLRGWISLLEHSGRALAPGTSLELLQSIVEAAAQIFHAAAASICLVDRTRNQLEFRVAYGEGNEDVVGQSIPVDQGIVGYVVMTGQPIAISDVAEDPRFNREFAATTGYVPRSILAMPLHWGDQVIGVMEVLDKIDSPAFGMQDMELMSLFARQAAIAIAQSEYLDRLSVMLLHGLEELSREDADLELAVLLDAVRSISAEEMDEELLALTDHVRALSEAGEEERALSLQILQDLTAYIKSKPRYS
jgi:GAF domain-containing protein